MRIEFSPSSNNVKYKMYYNNTKTDLLTNSQIDLIEFDNLGKKIIDINLDNNYDTIIFEVYNEKEENDINKMCYTLRYRTDKENKFKNYVTDGDIKLNEQKKENNMRNITLSIPTLKDNATSEIIMAEYYLKIYKYSENDLLINNTISIVDNLDPYQIIEFTINNTVYNHTITIPNDNNKYYIIINAITNERELLSYNAFIIDGEENKQNEDGKEKEKQEEKKNKEGLKWYWILIIILAVLILIVAILLVVRYILKNRKNQVEDEGQMIPLTVENKL